MTARRTWSYRGSHSLVDETGVEAGIDNELAPFGVERGGRLRCNSLISRPALRLKLRNAFTGSDQHIPEGLEFRPIADRLAVARNDDRIIGCCSEVCLRCRDHA